MFICLREYLNCVSKANKFKSNSFDISKSDVIFSLICAFRSFQRCRQLRAAVVLQWDPWIQPGKAFSWTCTTPKLDVSPVFRPEIWCLRGYDYCDQVTFIISSLLLLLIQCAPPRKLAFLLPIFRCRNDLMLLQSGSKNQLLLRYEIFNFILWF